MKKSKGRVGATPLGRDPHFSVSLKLIPTTETFQLKKIYNEMKIKALKSYCEFSTGIPADIQRLSYLDQGDLLDHLDVKAFDIVPNALLHMDVWPMWSHLIEAVAANDIEWVFRLGVTADSDYKTPNSEFMGAKAKREWLAERAVVALYVASHRGLKKLCEKLIQSGANVNGKTPLGHTALHVAAARGHGHIVDLLLEKGADINAEDADGDTALSIASRFGHKGCERHLFLFRWQQRAKQMRTHTPHEMFAHQYHDSAFPVWLRGRHAQVYYTKILPPQEYQGSSLGAPKKAELYEELSDGSDASENPVWDDEDEETEDGRLLRRPKADRKTITGNEMPSIEEEKRSAKQSVGDASRKKVVVSKATKQRMVKKGRRRSEDSFEKWLQNKEAEDHRRLVYKRMLQQKKQQEDDDSVEPKETRRKRQAEFQDKSYDQWLVDKEVSKGPRLKPPTLGATPPPAVSSTKNLTSISKQTTEDIIRRIIDRREKEAIKRGEEAAKIQEDFHFWLDSDNQQLFEHLVHNGPRTVLHL